MAPDSLGARLKRNMFDGVYFREIQLISQAIKTYSGIMLTYSSTPSGDARKAEVDARLYEHWVHGVW